MDYNEENSMIIQLLKPKTAHYILEEHMDLIILIPTKSSTIIVKTNLY